jgi:hypothetical protein
MHRMDTDKQHCNSSSSASVAMDLHKSNKKHFRHMGKLNPIGARSSSTALDDNYLIIQKTKEKRQPTDEDFSKDRDATVFYGSVVAFSRPESGLWLNVDYNTGKTFAKPRKEKNSESEWRKDTLEEEDIALFTVSIHLSLGENALLMVPIFTLFFNADC